MAEALFRHLSRELDMEIEVKSAGTHAYDGSSASRHSTLVLQEKGIEHIHRSQSVTAELIQWSDVIITMTTGHQSILEQMFPESKNKIYTLKKLAYGAEGWEQDVADPFGGSEEIYRETRNEIEQAIRQLLSNWNSKIK